MIKAFFRLIKLAVLAVVLIIGVNVFVMKSVGEDIVLEYDGSEESMTQDGLGVIEDLEAECILVLGASVNPDQTPSPMLQDRLDTGIALYEAGAAPKLLLSGDTDEAEQYNEVAVMEEYAVEAGVPREDIVSDHEGFSTYESVRRAAEVFGMKRMVVVTQKYHLYRALYGCEAMGIKALGAAAEQEVYVGQEKREVREVLARGKDCIKWFIKPEEAY